MHESFSSALNEMSVADAVMQLASGTVELALDDAPEFARWCWFADVLDSDWGLTGRLPAAGDDALTNLSASPVCAEHRKRRRSAPTRGGRRTRPRRDWPTARP